MIKVVESALKTITGNLISIKRDPVNGWYELEIGIPKQWVFDGNEIINCEVIVETDVGKIVKIFPKNDEIVIDDLILFVDVIIETNNRIALKEKEFTDKMNEMKNSLENEAKKFYLELDELKENAFSKLNNNFMDSVTPNDVKNNTKIINDNELNKDEKL